MYQSVVLFIPARLASAFVMLRIRSRVATSSCLLSSKGRGIELECFSSRVGETLRLCLRQRTYFLDKPFLSLRFCIIYFSGVIKWEGNLVPSFFDQLASSKWHENHVQSLVVHLPMHKQRQQLRRMFTLPDSLFA